MNTRDADRLEALLWAWDLEPEEAVRELIMAGEIDAEEGDEIEALLRAQEAA